MFDLLSRFAPGEFIAVFSIAGGLFFGAITLLLIYWHDLRKTEVLARLKQDMLDRGMSADEIKTVLDAGAKTSPQ